MVLKNLGINADLHGKDLREAILEGLMHGINLSQANLGYATLANATAIRANAEEASFFRATVHHTNLSQSNCRATVFDHADMCEVNFTWTDLSHASFLGSSLRGVKLWGAKLLNTNLRGAEGLVSKTKEEEAARYLIERAKETRDTTCINLDIFVPSWLEEWEPIDLIYPTIAQYVVSPNYSYEAFISALEKIACGGESLVS